MLALQVEEGGGLGNWKSQGDGFAPEPPERDATLPTPRF